MGIVDVFGKEDRIPVQFTEFYSLVQEAAKAELIMNAVNCDIPHKYIRETMTGTKESEPTKAESEVNNNEN